MMKSWQRWQGFSFVFLLVVICYLFCVQLWVTWPFTIDDMYIPLRYAKNWVNGAGLVWNVGEMPVEGYSNFSFVVLARLAISWNYDPVVVLKCAGILGLFFTALGLYAIARMWFLPLIAALPSLWLIAYKGQIIWSVSGLETSVYQAFITWAVFFLFKGMGYSLYEKSARNAFNSSYSFYFFIAGGLLSFAGFTRPEAPALILLFGMLLFVYRFDFLLYWRRGILVFIVSIMAFYVPYFLWRWHYFGHIFPNPVYCKGLSDVQYFTLDKQYLKLIWPLALLSAIGTRGKPDPRLLFLWLPSVVYLILLWKAHPIVAFYNRLFLPAFALLLPLSALGLQRLVENYGQGLAENQILMCFVGGLFTLFFIPMMSLSHFQQFIQNPIAGQQLRQKVVHWLGHHVPFSSQVVLADCGFIPYQSPHAFIDSYCLNNKAMTNIPIKWREEQYCQQLLEKKPEVIILTALIEKNKAIYPPTDACLAKKLVMNSDYIKRIHLETGDQHTSYRYEIFSKCSDNCSKMPSV